MRAVRPQVTARGASVKMVYVGTPTVSLHEEPRKSEILGTHGREGAEGIETRAAVPYNRPGRPPFSFPAGNRDPGPIPTCREATRAEGRSEADVVLDSLSTTCGRELKPAPRETPLGVTVRATTSAVPLSPAKAQRVWPRELIRGVKVTPTFLTRAGTEKTPEAVVTGPPSP